MLENHALARARSDAAYRIKICMDCNQPARIGTTGKRCNPCRWRFHKQWNRIAGPAHWKVHDAVQKGLLVNLRRISVPCVDCGKRADQYDHRSYAKPLEVEPVCNRCNKKRGPAIEIASLSAKRGEI